MRFMVVRIMPEIEHQALVQQDLRAILARNESFASSIVEGGHSLAEFVAQVPTVAREMAIQASFVQESDRSRSAEITPIAIAGLSCNSNGRLSASRAPEDSGEPQAP